MKGMFLISMVFLFGIGCYSQSTSQTNRMVLTGIFQGKNLYIQNPSFSGPGFCITRCTVNGEAPCENKSAFELDLYCHKLKLGDSVIVVIEHAKGCKPKILNPEVLLPESTFEIVDIDISTSGVLKWTTMMESGSLPFIIEQFRWGKWVKLGEVDGVGTGNMHEYSFNIQGNLHADLNKFRVKQIGFSGKPRLSESVEVDFGIQEISVLKKQRKIGKLYFTAETRYEVYDTYGNYVKKGFGSEIDLSQMRKGFYYVNYGNKAMKFAKR